MCISEESVSISRASCSPGKTLTKARGYAVRSVTQIPVAEAELAAMVARAFGSGAEIAEYTELPDGTYNMAYRVALTDGTDTILKVAPPAHLDRLTHEIELMRTEVDFYRLASTVAVPVPKVYYADLTGALLGRNFEFLERIRGTSLDKLDRSTVDLAAVRRDLGAAVARLHTVTGAAFGYPLRDSASWQPTWPEAYFAMLDDLLADARRLGTPLPQSPDAIRARMDKHASALATVGRPALVHFDLWDGNIFVEQRDGHWRLTGMIDGERAFYGDPYAEFISLALFRDVTELPELLAGYADQAGTPIEFTDPVRARIALITCYLYLIMLVEVPTRGFPAGEPVHRHTFALLGAQLDQL
jgi:aminoglycoside phosphotransferase (APT) family kinase protein